MPPRKKSTGPVPVEQITHEAKRVNLPTADAQEFVRPEIEERRQILIQRDPSLDPQLVWKGRYGDESADGIEAASQLAADAPPLFIQEKIDPRVLIDDLRREFKKKSQDDDAGSASSEQPALFESFEDFDGLDELDLVDFYSHSANWSNRLILGDSLQVMGSLAEREDLRGQVQMIYIDPPYGIKFGSNWQVSTRKRDVKDGKAEDAAREAEQIKAFRDTWELGIHSYLSYLRDRLETAKELLTESGSCFVQIGDENVHLVRTLMDEVFGSENFVSQISFVTTSGFSQAKGIGRNGDYVLWYARNEDQVKTRRLWREVRNRQSYKWATFPDGTMRGLTSAEQSAAAHLPEGARRYAPDNLVSQGAANEPQPFEHEGRTYRPPSNSHWKASYPLGMEKLAAAQRIHIARDSIRYVRYEGDFPLQAFTNNWTDTATGNFTDEKLYVVQTGSKVIERCMLLATDPGDLVLDPTCGSGTTAFVAEQWGRRWITIDTSRVALALTRQRLMAGKFPMYYLKDSEEGRQHEAKASGQPVLTDSKPTHDIRDGFVYQRVPHITLKSIANNPDIVPGMSREEIDAAITRHADVELLHDKPYENKKAVRVTGPFTVESLTPHRAVEFSGAESEELTSVSEYTTASERAAETQPDAPDFERSILDNLASAGIQNGIKNERMEFSSLEPYAGNHIQALGRAKSDSTQDGSTVGIVIGPQYGTVSQSQAKEAVREALITHNNPNTPAITTLAVLGFSFDPTIGEITSEGNTVDASEQDLTVAGQRVFGKVQLLFVRMNTDLLMGTQLKKTGSGNLFTVFGEPDIGIEITEAGVVVDLRGVDVYDPTTGEIRSSQPDQVALWMIDTDYNGDSFFVRHCYFTGGGDPYKRLKTALKADIDTEAWDTLYDTRSRPFPQPETGKIAVKVINDYGDEVMKVFEVN